MDKKLKYDLHIHSALSPCADNDMTPATIAGLCALEGIQLAALSDHNSAKNVPAFKAACDAYGVAVLPAIEVNTSEEIHLLCYFPSVEKALEMDGWLSGKLQQVKIDNEIWGDQLVMDEEDNVIATEEYLLTAAVDAGIYEVKDKCQNLGGIAVPAHADKDSFSVLSVLGFLPNDLDFPAIELKDTGKYQALSKKGFLPEGKEILSSSDAHSVSELLRNDNSAIGSDSRLWNLIMQANPQLFGD